MIRRPSLRSRITDVLPVLMAVALFVLVPLTCWRYSSGMRSPRGECTVIRKSYRLPGPKTTGNVVFIVVVRDEAGEQEVVEASRTDFDSVQPGDRVIVRSNGRFDRSARQSHQ